MAEDEGPPVAEPPEPRWRSLPRPETIQVAGQRRNSPLAIFAVLGLVLVVVLAMGAPGKFTTAVAGTPLAAPPVENKPNAAAPNTVTPTTTSRSSKPRWQELTEANPLLTPGLQLPQITCKLPGFGRSADQLRAYYQAMIGCLDEAWRPLLEQADHVFESPKLSVDDAPTSSCGTPSREEAVAFYCPRDKGIFMPRSRVNESMGSNQGGHVMVLAHEYGHHVQALSRINQGMGMKMAGMDEGSPEYLELTRRMELQADCFSGMFIGAAGGRGSITKSLSNSASSAFRSSVADKTHGSVKHQIQWGTAGVKNNNTASCNTWLAPAGEVS
ncbi:neutral zinc metallopeptidase [Kibdelosporangium persicum]|uniref:YpfJ protein, zinc metalloprotease superfamily n=1 Tax=Kibdelosporangium persicum TaxID=2698649 RepID=A0ABX2F9L7_9PSEU|nr:neutral zinc metallopeptidase [Kibdelosporangium persicum]NRN68066.1 YpfJ protein, zinc metalloprotease superfamily [Kibdelosporangium persicum]